MTDPIAQAIYGRLTGDGTLTAIVGTRVHEKSVPPGGVTYPLVMFQLVSAPDRYTFGGSVGSRRAEPLYLVKVVDRTRDATNARTAAERIYTLMTDGLLTVTGFNVEGVQRIETIDFEEPDGEQVYQHVGGMYRLWLQRL